MADDSEESDQSGGLLTPPQREYLRGRADIESDSTHERVTRSRIRDRLHAAFTLDFELLGESLRADDRDQVLEDLDVGVAEGLIEMVAWVHQVADSVGLESERVLQEGLERGETRLGNGDITVEVEMEMYQGLERLQDRFEAGDPTLTGTELARLQLEEAINTDQLGEYYGEALGEQPNPDKVSTDMLEEMVDTDSPKSDRD